MHEDTCPGWAFPPKLAPLHEKWRGFFETEFAGTTRRVLVQYGDFLCNTELFHGFAQMMAWVGCAVQYVKNGEQRSEQDHR